MKKLLSLKAPLCLALGALLLLPALAQAGHRGGFRGHGGGHYHGRGGWSIGIGVPLVVPLYYPGYAGRTYYYDDEPVGVARVVERRTVMESYDSGLVAEAQRILARKGYEPGPVDGEWGPQTRAAVRDWQRDAGLPVTGRLDTATRRSLAL